MSVRVRRPALGYRSLVFTFVLLFLAYPASAMAQAPAPNPRWEASFYGGALNGNIPLQGIFELPEQQPLFNTVNGKLSRNMPSWFFGRGADFYQQLATQAQIPQRITTLDPLVFFASSERANSWIAGARISRAMNPRAALEGSIEFSRSPVALTDSARTTIEASRDTFVTAWNAMLALDPVTFQNVNVTATSQINDGSMSQFTAEGAVLINILTRRRNTPYVAVGGGFVRHMGDSPSATLTGRIRTTLNGTAPIDETDTMTLSYALDRTVVSASIRLGIKRMMGERWGVRGEMREQLSSNPLTHVVTTSPSRLLATSAAEQGAAATPAFVAVQFSNIATTPSTLGLDLNRFQAFGGTGMESRLSFSGGIFWRF